jgi:hypothetical protein
MMSATLFTYSVSPDEVECSDLSVTPPLYSRVSLEIDVTNGTGRFVECPRITFGMPHGFGADALTLDPSTIGTAPGARAPWFIGGGPGRWVALPLPPATGLAAGQTVSFRFTGVVVNGVPAKGVITVAEQTDAIRHFRAEVRKRGRVTHGDTPVISEFLAMPDRLGQGGFTTLSWSVADADRVELLPGPIPVDSAFGARTVPVMENTVFRLRATGTGGTAEADTAVVVEPVVIDTFTAEPADSAGPGKPVRLSWSTSWASHCELDQGVGAVATSGEVHVRPDQTTVYTLTAGGRQPQSAAVTVTVPHPDQRA